MSTQNIGAEDKIDGPQEQAIPESTRVSVDLNDLDLDVADEGPIAQGDLGAADRKGRRTQWRELKEARDKAEQRAQLLENQMAEMRGRMSAQPTYVPVPAQPRQDAPDPGEGEIESLWEQQQMILKAIQSPASTQADVDKATEQWRRIERRRQGLIVRQAMREHGAPQDDGTAAEDKIVNQLLRADFPEVFANPAMVTRAIGEMQDLMARGKPKSPAVAREACERVMERFGLRRGRPAAPSEAERAKYTAVPSRAGQGASASGTYTPTPLVLRSARAYTSHLPDLSDEERVRKWARDVGRPQGLL